MTTLFRSSSHRRRRLVAAETLLLLAGFVLLGWAGYMTAQSILSNSWSDYRFEQSLAGENPTLIGYLKFVLHGRSGQQPKVAEEEAPVIEAPPPVAPPARKYAPNELIGRIEIARLNVNAVVREGTDHKTLSRSVGHVPKTALPGQQGNVGVAAHRDTYFRGLRNVKHGDVIRLTTTDGVYLYEIDKLKIVWPENVEVLDPTPDNRITLVTCYPFNYVGSAPKRFIVQGKQVGFEAFAAGGRIHDQQASSARSPKAKS